MQRSGWLLLAIVAVVGLGLVACGGSGDLDGRIGALEEQVDELIEAAEGRDAATTPIVIQVETPFTEGRLNNDCSEATPLAVTYSLGGQEGAFCTSLEGDCYAATPTIGEPLPAECR